VVGGRLSSFAPIDDEIIIIIIIIIKSINQNWIAP
jgi:hypothetical protein